MRSRFWHLETAAVPALAFAAEVALMAGLATGRTGPVWTAAAHLGVVGLLLLWRHSYRRRHHPLRMGELFILATAVLGPAGALGTLLSWSVWHVALRHPGDYAAWRRALLGEAAGRRGHHPHGWPNAETESPAAPALPFTDVIRYGRVDEKQALVMTIARDFRPAFAPALRLALQDPRLRSQAAVAVARIEDRFAERAIRLTEAAHANPASSRAWLTLARHLDDYAFVGLWDEDRQVQLREQSLAAYRICLQMDPESADVATAVGRLLCRGGWVEEAAEVLRPVAYGGDGRTLALSWYGECLYRLGRFEELQHLVRTASYVPGFQHSAPRLLRVAADLWNQAFSSRLKEVV